MGNITYKTDAVDFQYENNNFPMGGNPYIGIDWGNPKMDGGGATQGSVSNDMYEYYKNDRYYRPEYGNRAPLIPGMYKSSLDNLGYHVRNFEAAFNRGVAPVAQGAALFMPPVSLTNDVKILTTGFDMYGNPASWLDKGMAVGGILTLGTSHWVSWIPSWYSAGRATYQNW